MRYTNRHFTYLLTYSGPPVSEMIYAVLSGTLNSTIPYQLGDWCSVFNTGPQLIVNRKTWTLVHLELSEVQWWRRVVLTSSHQKHCAQMTAVCHWQQIRPTQRNYHCYNRQVNSQRFNSLSILTAILRVNPSRLYWTLGCVKWWWQQQP